jgi:hypothetical protein
MLMLMTLLACGEKDDTADTAPTQTDWEKADEVLATSCGFSSCHGGGAGQLTLTADDPTANHAAIVNVPSNVVEGATLVVPGDSSGSYLVHKLNDAEGIEGTEMPPGQVMDAERIALITAWIDAGAEAF